MSQTSDLHRALLRPAVIHTLRAAGFHSTKPSVLDTLVDLAERHLLLLASTTAQHAFTSRNDSTPTLDDVRMALSDCGVLLPYTTAAEESWQEMIRRPLLESTDDGPSKAQRYDAMKRKRNAEDVKDIRDFSDWFESTQYREIKRVAGILPDPDIAGIVGVGGNVVQGDDYFTMLKKKHNKGGDDSRLQGTVLGLPLESKAVLLDGGPAQRLDEWSP